MRAGLTIGDFAQITHLSIKTLRRYHEGGLLEPAQVDPSSGYRYYSTDQVPLAQVIRRFRDLGMPVREVRDVVTTADPEKRNALIAVHLDRLEGQLAETRAAVVALRRLLQPTPPPLEVHQRTVPARTVAAIGASVARRDVVAWYAGALEELDRTFAAGGLTATGPLGGLFDNALFTEDQGEAIVYLPVAEPPVAGRVAPLDIAPAELATKVHHGSHDDIDVTYGALGSYVTEQALAIAGPVHEVYLVGPRDTDDASAWRTEIGWPVFRTTAD
jgi:DNA-binding transcriptional MerR regulator